MSVHGTLSAGTTSATDRKSRNARSSAAVWTSAGTGGSIALSSSVNGIDETMWSAAYSVVTPSASATTAVARPPSWRIVVTGVSMMTLEPAASTCSRQRSHIIPGPCLGYWNSSIRLVTCLDLSRRAPAKRARRGSHTALHRVMPLMRCAPQSAEICEGGVAHTFSL